MAVWFKFVGFLPKVWLLRLAVRPAGGRGGAPGKLSSGCFIFPARVVVFSFSSDACLVVARVFARHCLFLVGRPFSFSPAGRLSMRWVGPSSASLRLAPVCSRVRRGLLQRASCMSAGLGGAHFLSSFSGILVVPRANHPFLHVFPLFPTATRKCVCVCVSGSGAGSASTPIVASEYS